MSARTSQGAIAGAISLVTFPWLALVMYATEDFSHRPFHFKLAVRFARLMAPIL
jgi:hypothetical protein